MAAHLDDEEQLEQLKSWLNENWIALVSGLVIGFGAIGGWKGYEAYVDKRGEAASGVYEAMKKDLEGDKHDEAAGLADELVAKYGKTPYASAGALRMAQAEVKKSAWDEASKRLTWVIDNGGDDNLVSLARVRKARVLFAQGKNDEALTLLNGGTADPSLDSVVEELRGDIQVAKGDKDGARSSYAKALGAAEEQAPNRGLLQQKIDDLAVATAAAEPTAAAPAPAAAQNAAPAVKP